MNDLISDNDFEQILARTRVKFDRMGKLTSKPEYLIITTLPALAKREEPKVKFCKLSHANYQRLTDWMLNNWKRFQESGIGPAEMVKMANKELAPQNDRGARVKLTNHHISEGLKILVELGKIEQGSWYNSKGGSSRPRFASNDVRIKYIARVLYDFMREAGHTPPATLGMIFNPNHKIANILETIEAETVEEL
jgi:hypothetical protein